MFAHLRRLSKDMEIEPLPSSFNDITEHEFAVAALCHDIGHTAFSHVFEQTLLPHGITNHEDCTVALLDMPEIKASVSAYCDHSAVLQLFDGSHPLPALCTLIAGVVDVDRCDYLLRDSCFTGVEYGRYDLSWLIHSMSLITGKNALLFLILDGPRGLDAFRQYIQARRSMYRQVYYHPTIRAAQKLLRSLFERAQDVSDCLTPAQVPLVLHSVIFQKERPSLSDFLSTNDFTIMSAVHQFSCTAPDPVLKHLALSFVNRKLPKVIYDSTQAPPGTNIVRDRADDIVTRLRARIKQRLHTSIPGGADAVDYSVLLDVISFPSIPLADVYFHMGGQSYTLDKLRDWGGDFDLGELVEKFEIFRIFVPEEARSEARAFIEEEQKK